jgi:hypothetical protein
MRARVCVCVLLALAGCGRGASSNPGLRDRLRIPGAQYVPGPLPTDTSGPSVTSAAPSASIVIVGRTTTLNGLVPKPTQAVAVGVPGDAGYWIITPSVPDVLLTDQLTFTARLQMSSQLAPGELPVTLRAVSPDGRFGPPFVLPLTITTTPIPDGQLVVSLLWDTESDLDLHVVIPDGSEIWAHNINSWVPPPPGQLPDPNAWKTGGILDFDSNSGCVLDGRRLEDVYWQQTPPSGHYIVRVDTPSLCGEIDATWTVIAKLQGKEIGRAHGFSRDSDVRYDHAKGSGLTALQFDVP